MKTFLGTFNMNGEPIQANDAQKWLSDAAGSKTIDGVDLVILSLQECKTFRNEEDDGHVISLESMGEDINFIQQHTQQQSQQQNRNDNLHLNHLVSQYNAKRCDKVRRPCCITYGPPPSIEKLNEDIDRQKMKGSDGHLLSNIQTALSSQHELVVDISMGEEPSSINAGNGQCSTEGTQWYGFIRLLVYAKQEIASHLLSASNQIIPILSPCGHKSSSSYDITPTQCGKTIANQLQYAPMSSPDKGSVSVILPSLNILCSSLHLAGTNSRNRSEDYFDSIRIRQLHQCLDDINCACRHLYKFDSIYNQVTPQRGISLEKMHDDVDFSVLDNFYPILLGDLNFRCEVYTKVEDKVRGGRDFTHVHVIIRNGDVDAIKHLFCNNDRLVKLLANCRSPTLNQTIGTDHLPKIFHDVVDVVASTFETAENQHNDLILPTFTFPVGLDASIVSENETTIHQRPYSNKRTPSWTDRILIHKALFSDEGNENGIQSKNAYYDIRSSDHVPVSCFLHLFPPKLSRHLANDNI